MKNGGKTGGEKMVNKILAAAITVAFLSLVRPDPTATEIGYVISALLIYETLAWCIGYVRKVNHRKQEKHYITLTKADIRRWANEQLYWPIHEEVG